MRILNLGIVAHVDAGKTTLTERLLYEAGIIREIGSVDHGTTQTDFLPLERQRGITIKSAVVSFPIGNTTVNLIDTPGHPDFIAEVERVLSVLDGAVLVLSAVEGVQPQTRILLRTLQRLRIPTLLFVNKIDRKGARYGETLASVAQRLTPLIIALTSVDALGTLDVVAAPYGSDDAGFTVRLAELLAERDEVLLAEYVADEHAISYRRLRRELARQTASALVYPVFFGSAITGAGIETLTAGIEELLPAAGGDADGSPAGTVFKVERGPAGEKIAYIRMFSGALRTRDRVSFGQGHEAKVTGIRVFVEGSDRQRAYLAAGEIGKLWGLRDVRIGDTIGETTRGAAAHYFAPPSLEAAVVPRRPGQKAALHSALAQLAEQDPLINLRQDDLRQEMYVSLYGEVQKEVIEATLESEYDLEVEFRGTFTIHVERPTGCGETVEVLGKDGNPFLATLGLRVEPGPIDSGVVLRLAVDVEAVPLYVYKSVDEFRKSMEENVRQTLSQGLHGWQVIGCLVTLTRSGYAAPATTARDFRLLTPLVLMDALSQAGTEVLEPVQRFHLEIPADSYGATTQMLARLGTVPESTEMRGGWYVLEGRIRAAHVQALRQQLTATTRGEGVLETDFDSYQPVADPVPTRPRTDYNPLNRKEYLLRLAKRL